MSSAAAKTFLLFVTFCKKSKQYPQESSLPSPARKSLRSFLLFSGFALIREIRVIRGVCKNPNFPRKASQNFTQYISEWQK